MPLYLAFLWHMHQPYYADTVTGRAALPWVRFHGAKNYQRMSRILADYPKVRAAFNFVPSLLEQIEGYLAGSITDRLQELASLQPWSVGEEDEILSLVFHVPQGMIREIPRYRELYDRHQRGEFFKESEALDLLVLLHLAWSDENYVEEEPALRRLVEKGKNYTRQDLEAVVAEQLKIMGQIIPAYRDLEQAGQVELTASPYFHPILPLIVDTSSAQEASPHILLPNPPFRGTEDAREQVRRAVEFHAARFGHSPQGIWPSEGAVGQGMLSSVAGQAEWIASDEGILARSLGLANLGPDSRFPRHEQGIPLDAETLYQAYALNCDPPLAIIFRDRFLSDLISFEYQKWDGEKAAEDLVGRLHKIITRLPQDKPYIVPIILDGENPWDNYPGNGEIFLRHLYELLSYDNEIETITPGEYIRRFPPKRRIERLATGSWIRANLEIWIGEPAHKRAWEALGRARGALLSYQTQNPERSEILDAAWRDLFIAEGSDWFWWYSSNNSSPQAAVFDETFRTHLANGYKRLGLASPESLHSPFA